MSHTKTFINTTIGVHCQSLTKKGTPCSRSAKISGYCTQHHKMQNNSTSTSTANSNTKELLPASNALFELLTGSSFTAPPALDDTGTGLQRLENVMQMDPEWGAEIAEFMNSNPEFKSYMKVLPYTRYPMGYGKNKSEPLADPSMPRNDSIIEHLIYYVCCAGVRYTYALKQWSAMCQVLRENGYNIGAMVDRLETTLPLQPRKIQVYRDIQTWLTNHDLKPSEMTLETVTAPTFKVKGVGAGAIAHLKKFFGNSASMAGAVEYTDRGFIGGFCKVYGLEKKPTTAQIMKKVQEWGDFKAVGNVMCFQVYHYC